MKKELWLMNQFMGMDGGAGSGGGLEQGAQAPLETAAPDDTTTEEVDETESLEFEDVDLATDPFTGAGPELTPDSIAAAVERGLSRGAAVNPQEQSPRTYSQEEREAFMTQMGRPRLDLATVQALFGEDATPEQRIATLQQLLDQTSQYSMRVAQTAFEAQLASLRGEYQPLVQQTQAQNHNSYLSQIETNFPTLKGHSRIINLAIAELKKSGYKPRSPEADQQAIAITAGRMIKEIKPDFVLQKARGGGRGSKPAMASGLTSAGGGGSQTRKPQVPKDPGLAVLQARRARLGIG